MMQKKNGLKGIKVIVRSFQHKERTIYLILKIKNINDLKNSFLGISFSFSLRLCSGKEEKERKN